MSAAVIVDDSELQEEVAFVGPDCVRSDGGVTAYGGTLLTCRPRDATGSVDPTRPHLRLDFAGPEIMLRGRPDPALRMRYMVDDTVMREAEIIRVHGAGPMRQDGAPIWRLAGLSSGVTHRVSLFPYAGELVLDYFVSTPPQPLANATENATFMVDDTDLARIVKGPGPDTWSDGTADSRPLAPIPFNKTSSRTVSPGATLELNLKDIPTDRISLHGLLSRSPGTVRVRYQVDAQPPLDITHQPPSQPPSQPAPPTGPRWDPITFFSKDLEPGFHSVKATILEITDSQDFQFDFATYRKVSPNAVASPGTTGTSGSGSNNGTPTPPFSGGGDPTATSPGIDGQQDLDEGKALNRTAILGGGIAGGLVALLVLIAGLVTWKKARGKKAIRLRQRSIIIDPGEFQSIRNDEEGGTHGKAESGAVSYIMPSVGSTNGQPRSSNSSVTVKVENSVHR